MTGTVWSLMPAIVAIILALTTKEVYVSLLVGILGGALYFTEFKVIQAVEVVLEIMSNKIGGNVNILIFLILLGMLVSLVQKSGASKAYGEWASQKIKTSRGALAITSLLGVLIFVDDYFNCLTVGTVMSPVTDKHKITRAKLAYIIDSTAAPVCILSPISSWAAAISSSLPEGSKVDGFQLFLKTIPYNIYAIITLVMVVLLITYNFDFSRMKSFENNVKNQGEVVISEETSGKKGKIRDLIFPILLLIVSCIWFMLYTGGILTNPNVIDAFSNCDASLALVLGSFFTIIIVGLYYIPRKVLKFTEFAESLSEGFKAMVPAILVLVLAWTLSGISGSGYLESGIYVSELVTNNSISLSLIPAVFFLVAAGLSFSTGTSWGTFGILIPIILHIFGGVDSNLLAISISAVLAGAVSGDHISPISDTTILSSAGAGCPHIDHIQTQLPYAGIAIGISFIGYLISGYTDNGYLGLLLSVVAIIAIVSIIYRKQKRKAIA